MFVGSQNVPGSLGRNFVDSKFYFVNENNVLNKSLYISPWGCKF